MDVATPTRLDYFEDMSKLKSKATILSYFKVIFLSLSLSELVYRVKAHLKLFLSLKCDDERTAVILDRTVFHPQGGGQPADLGFIVAIVDGDSELKFVVQDVRTRDGVVSRNLIHRTPPSNRRANFQLEISINNNKSKKIDRSLDWKWLN